ncbi:MAG TPA: NAD(P)/FAD-dependent oxidoreductase [Pyrinomonadaceae bacterium]|jgi:phytoene dehydrogenase-like protein|nr:NAD(P)/FAD-dependent oxidoreductase [Pyrinomonadaceae bacterium]
MPNRRERIVIIGAGHNGLVAAFYLARAGFAPLVIERREVVGGACVTEEFYRGFRCSTLAHSAGPLLPQVARDLRLERRGLSFVRPEVRVFAPSPVARSLCLYDDPARTASGLQNLSTHDASKYTEFQESFARIGRVLAPLIRKTPPSVDAPTAGDLWNLGKLGKDFRGLGKRDAYRLLRWGPMAVADLVAEWFETELLRATVAARGIYGAFAGPWSAGTSLALLLQAAFDGQAIAPAAFVRGGMGALTQALSDAAREAGAEVRTGVGVERVLVKDGRAAGVVLEGGEEVAARAVVSNADPRTTFLRLVDPTDLEPGFLTKIRNYRSKGAAAKVNLALDGLPSFAALKNAGADAAAELSGRIHIGPDIDYLERAFDAAKYGDFSHEPYMDITIPTLSDPSLAPEGKHVMSVYVQFAPYNLKDGDWTSRREEFADAVVKTLSTYAPNIKDLIIQRQVITPHDLEREYGLSGGHPLHGEMSLDQFYAFRPVIGWAQYRTPLRGLHLCGAGTHPGGGVTGAPGANASREILKDLRESRRS